MTVHNFNASLKSALTYTNQELLEQACRDYFPRFAHMTYNDPYSKHPSNLQARGVDWIVCLKDPNGHGRAILIDDKVSSYADNIIFLEVGWIIDPTKVCDYIAVLKPNCSPPTVYFLPFHALQRAWQLYGDQWTERYGLKTVLSEQNGRTWETLGVPLPAPRIYAATKRALVIVVPS